MAYSNKVTVKQLSTLPIDGDGERDDEFSGLSYSWLFLAILGKYPDMYPWILIVSGYSSNSQGYKYPDTSIRIPRILRYPWGSLSLTRFNERRMVLKVDFNVRRTFFLPQRSDKLP